MKRYFSFVVSISYLLLSAHCTIQAASFSPASHEAVGCDHAKSEPSCHGHHEKTSDGHSDNAAPCCTQLACNTTALLPFTPQLDKPHVIAQACSTFSDNLISDVYISAFARNTGPPTASPPSGYCSLLSSRAPPLA